MHFIELISDWNTNYQGKLNVVYSKLDRLQDYSNVDCTIKANTAKEN